MIFNRITAMALLLMFACNTSASDTLSVVGGKVSDFDTGESLPFAKVRIKDTTRFSTSNQDGLFKILNVYDRENEWYTEYDIIEGTILETKVNFRGITPSLFITWNLY